MPSRLSSRLQEVSGSHVLSTEKRDWRLPEARGDANEAGRQEGSGQRKAGEVTADDKGSKRVHVLRSNFTTNGRAGRSTPHVCPVAARRSLRR